MHSTAVSGFPQTFCPQFGQLNLVLLFTPPGVSRKGKPLYNRMNLLSVSKNYNLNVHFPLPLHLDMDQALKATRDSIKRYEGSSRSVRVA